MIKQQKKIWVLILCLIIILLNGCTETKVKVAPKLNAKAPNFVVSNLDGDKINLDEIKDKIIIVSFWKIESPSAIRQLKSLKRIQNKYSDKVRILAVNVQDKTPDINDFVIKNDYDFEIINDKDGKISNQYALSIFPTSFLIDKDGIIKEIKKYDELTEVDPILTKLNS